MTKRTKAVQARHQQDMVYAQWTSRPPERRTANCTEQFTDDLWSQGLRLGRSPEMHRQMMMNVIRRLVVDR